MSCDIIYEQAAGRIPATILGAVEDIFVVVQLIGDSRTYDSGTRRRSRDWKVAFAGTRNQVMTEAICFAGDFESQMTKWKSANGALLPEEYIAKVRRQLAGARELNDEAILCGGFTVFLRLQLPSDTSIQGVSIGKESFSMLDEQQMREFFRRYQADSEFLPLQSCMKVGGVPR